MDAPPEEKDAALAEAQALRKQLPDIPIVPRILVDDVSPEKLASLLADQGGRLALMSAEGGVFDMMAGRYSNGAPNLDVYLKAHAGDTIRVDRVGRPPEHVNSPALTIGLTIQPDVLRGLARKPGFRGRGLLARFSFCLPPSGIGHRKIITEPVHPGEIATYQRIILDLFRYFDRRSRNTGLESTTDNCRTPPAPVILTLAADAAGLFRVFRTEIEHELAAGGRFAFLGDWAGKLCGTVARIAGILHMIKQAHEQSQGQPWDTEISADTMRAALTIGDYLADHALVAFEFMGGDPIHEAATHALAWIDRNEKTQFSLRDAHQALKGRYRDVADIENALSVLEEHGYVRKISETTHPQAGSAAKSAIRRQPTGSCSKFSERPENDRVTPF